MIERATSFALLGLVVCASCGSFGSSSDDAPAQVAPVDASAAETAAADASADASTDASTQDVAPKPRAVKCNGSTCTGSETCCIDTAGSGSCSAACTEVSMICDDSADCPGGLVCCVDLDVVSSDAVNIVGASCRAATDCQKSAAPTNGERLVGCDPLDFAADCKGKGCAVLGSRYSTVYPNATVYVCD